MTPCSASTSRSRRLSASSPATGPGVFGQWAELVVPPMPGLLCALGCLVADLRADFVRSLWHDSRDMTDEQVNATYQQFLVEARPGAGGTLATQAVARAAPDGYTLMMINDNHAVNPSVFKSIPYDSFKDFAFIGFVGSAPMVLSVNAKVPARSVGELARQALVGEIPAPDIHYAALMAGDRIVVHGAANKAMVFSRRFMSEAMQASMNQKLYTDVPAEDRERERGDIENRKAS